MSAAAAQSLCTECGLCCSGAIFADVELRDRREAISMECLGLEIEEEDGRSLLIQPCRALIGTKCTVYAHRPGCCRSFECKLLKEYQSNETSLNEALDVVRDLREKLSGQDRESARIIIGTRFLNRRA